MNAAETKLTTWSNGSQTQAAPAYRGLEEVDASRSFFVLISFDSKFDCVPLPGTFIPGEQRGIQWFHPEHGPYHGQYAADRFLPRVTVASAPQP